MTSAPNPVAGRPRRIASALLAMSVAAAAGVYMARALAAFPLDQQPIGYAAPMDFSDYNLASGTSVAFRGDFVSATWDGDLVAHNVSAAGAFSVKWRASEQVPAAASRKIFTSTTSGSGAVFRWTGTGAISAAQQALLGDGTTGPKVLDYLRGDASNEISASNPYPTGMFRPRYSKIGAIIHSRPYHDGNEVYVGANDGMLHAFDAATGVERFAYVPSMLFAGNKLRELSTPYTTAYKYYVDGALAVGPVGSSKMLFAGLGAGAKGLFALDITNPAPASEAAAASMAKWEITEATTGYANLGNVMSAPQLVKLNIKEGGSPVTALLVPDGLNSTGKASALFVIRASDGGKLGEITAGAALADGSENGLGAISAVDSNGDGTIDVVYAGDLAGTLWKFDLSSTSALPTGATAVFSPDASTARPITAAPSVSLHPRGGLMINFGTGKAYSQSDLDSTATEYLYGVWDSGSVTSASLVTQTLTPRTVPSSTTVVRTASSSAVNYSGSHKGWRIALTGGERLIGNDTLTDSGRFVVTTSIPNAGASQGSWLLQVSALTGSAPAAPFFDLDGDGKIDTAGNSDRIVVTSGATTSAEVPVGKFLGSGIWSQPVLAQVTRTLDVPFFNYNPNIVLPPYTTVITTTPPPSGESGVYGGHFDFDIFYNCATNQPFSKSGCGGHSHTHEYDDKYNVVGVNMLNPSNGSYNLANAITTTATPSFKILLANTRWSPAASLVVNDKISGLGWTLPVSPDGFLAETNGGPAATFTRATLAKFIYVLPLTAFTNKDWGTGEVRSGLIPSQTGCVTGNGNPSLAWMDGAFTIQVVNASASGGDVQASAPADTGGFRLKDNVSARAKLLAQYTVFWHHPNGKCKTAAGWTMTPAADTAPGKAGSSPAGTDDPKGDFASGVIGGPGGGGTGSTTVKHYYDGIEVLVTRSVDSSGVRQILHTTSGNVVSDVKSEFGVAKKADLQTGLKARLGRLGWKEILR